MLNEDGVAGQVAMDDWRVTGVEVAGYSERTVVRKQSQIEARIPPLIPSLDQKKTGMQRVHAKDSREVQFCDGHQYLG